MLSDEETQIDLIMFDSVFCVRVWKPDKCQQFFNWGAEFLSCQPIWCVCVHTLTYIQSLVILPIFSSYGYKNPTEKETEILFVITLTKRMV